MNTKEAVFTLCCCSRRSCSSMPCESPCNTHTSYVSTTHNTNTDVLHLCYKNLCFKAQAKYYLLYGYLLLQHHGSSMLGHRQLIILCHAWRGQPRGLHAHVDARRRRACSHHSHRWNHAHTRRHGWHGHLRHGRHPWHLDGGGSELVFRSSPCSLSQNIKFLTNSLNLSTK